MAIILTVILVVTGTASPVLAAELVSASGELIPASEELVSAAVLSDDNELDMATAPEITEIEEHKDMAEIPAGEADVSTGEADVPTDEADVPTDAVTPTDDLDMHEDADIPTATEFTSVCWLADRKISLGYNGVTYGPKKNCTRRDFTIFMYRAAGAPTVTNAMLSAVRFPDIQSCSATAKKAIAWAVNAGIIKGYSERAIWPA